jgi:hypothetical protein
MSNYIESKYLNLLSAQLSHFKQKNDNLWNFRCPYCLDSQTNLNKARGYVFLKEASYIFKCHNCGHGASLNNLIKHVNPMLHKEYAMEKFKDSGGHKKVANTTTAKTKTEFRFKKKASYLKTPLGKLKKVSQLMPGHKAKRYVVSRMIPSNYHFKLFYAPKFYEFVNQCIPNKFPEISKDEPRLIIPFIDQDDNLIGFQGRALGNSDLKYITIMIDEDAPKIFGLDTMDPTKPVYVVEGPIDSMFVNNAIAMAGADVSGLDRISADYIFVYDNEPRSAQIVRRIKKSIDRNHAIVLFPKNIREKDINDMIMSGMSVSEVSEIISSNTFDGLAAKAKLSEWSRV